MKRETICKTSVQTTAEAEDAVAELLATHVGSNPSTYTDAETGVTTVSVYSTTAPKNLAATKAALRRGLTEIKTCGLNVGSAKVSARQIRRENWAESWKRHFKPIEVGNALLIKPSWSKRRARKGQAVVVLDPGLSFGTGHHPTTSFCLHELTRGCARPQSQAFLDLGTGSGILAIVAAKLGYSPVHALDFDPESVRVARANARLNHVSQKIRLAHQDLTRLPLRPAQRYDLICANLISTLLVVERRRIVRRLKPGGRLVVAGILKSEFDLVTLALTATGLRLVASKVEKEWRSGAFVLLRQPFSGSGQTIAFETAIKF
ncbi:MAG: 50S ribosomal protein L11 methyltransferase [Verrucomicrobia bacterium]|nr:50S ribosomal protein L11 methyltransferase [Verrucomicrobiota bacterium]